MKKQKICLLLCLIICLCTGCVRTDKISNEKKEEPIVLTVLAGQSTSDAGIEDMIDEVIAEKFPNVKLEWDCVDWGEKFDSQMYARFAAGEVPDIMIGKAQDIYAYAASGNLAMIPDSCYDKISKQALDAVTLNGVVYGLPYNALYQGVLYNKDIFKKYQIEPPMNIKDLEETVATLEKKHITPFASHFQENWQIGNMTMQFFMNDLFMNDPYWGDLFRAKKESFSDNTTVLHCLKQNEYILNHSWSDALVLDQYECDKRFIQGEAAMYLTGSWSLQSISQYGSRGEYGIFPYPNQEGNAALIHETNLTFMKSITTEYGEIINQIFEELITNKKLIQNILEFTQTYPTIKGVSIMYKNGIDQDIKAYEDGKQVMEVTIGNRQLVWTFQKDIAAKQQEWLCGNLGLQQVLTYADKHRGESSNCE
ncbi:MAG: ABC transporter substrate-binding protein [Velocimicrobium sp.]